MEVDKLAEAAPWPFVQDDTTSFFLQELRRLRSLDLIAGRPNKGVRSLLREGGDVKDISRSAREVGTIWRCFAKWTWMANDRIYQKEA